MCVCLTHDHRTFFGDVVCYCRSQLHTASTSPLIFISPPPLPHPHLSLTPLLLLLLLISSLKQRLHSPRVHANLWTTAPTTRISRKWQKPFCVKCIDWCTCVCVCVCARVYLSISGSWTHRVSICNFWLVQTQITGCDCVLLQVVLLSAGSCVSPVCLSRVPRVSLVLQCADCNDGGSLMWQHWLHQSLCLHLLISGIYSLQWASHGSTDAASVWLFGLSPLLTLRLTIWHFHFVPLFILWLPVAA